MSTIQIVYLLIGILTFFGTASALYYYAPVNDPKNLCEHGMVGLLSAAVGTIWIIVLLFLFLGLILYAAYSLAAFITSKVK